ncbi:uncharacterized protein B0I36DRAFT_394704 [Microdochium trichocladiopsis]|uniref:Uncharacterized protein n=1 Tax=Microdochium trichocladiopsis TaxID=1682393 RepID=A0A9P8XTJ9_9PEZI|nr:uncharacterized protein B0I36DRAFT_394704 [Microdochium trichocladiopsis]KAH7018080.1 hypothetical protein B0I36DRAFT_394704 [Microdochium trichocladiopsis]
MQGQGTRSMSRASACVRNTKGVQPRELRANDGGTAAKPNPGHGRVCMVADVVESRSITQSRHAIRYNITHAMGQFHNSGPPVDLPRRHGRNGIAADSRDAGAPAADRRLRQITARPIRLHQCYHVWHAWLRVSDPGPSPAITRQTTMKVLQRATFSAARAGHTTTS